MAERIAWNEDWCFAEFPYGEEAKEISFVQKIKEEQWKTVSLPHDWMISDTTALYRDSIGWYRKCPEMKCGEDREVLLRFDGIYMDSTVFCNGQKVMDWKYGYSPFEADLTPYVRNGKNEILIRVIYRHPNSRWYSGAGIYRNVWMKVRPVLHIASDGVYITPEKNADGSWKVKIQTEIEGRGAERYRVVKLVQTILAPKGKTVSVGGRLVDKEELEKQQLSVVSMEMQAGEVQLWQVGEGNVYRLRTQLYADGTLLETEENSFGFRTLEYTQDRGLSVNGKRVKIHGVCEHHDLGCLGAAFSKDAMRRKLDKLRGMGVNAIRTSHNMPAEEFLDLADEMGFLIDDEGFDMWKNPKTEYDYARFFDEWVEKDIRNWIRRDRNHPCVIMWSIGNEITDTVWDAGGKETAVRMRDAIRRWDELEHAPVTMASNYLQFVMAQSCTEELELAGYNYLEYLYPKHHAEKKDWKIYGSEACSVLSSRNIYHFPKEAHVINEVDEQCSSLGNTIIGWGADSYEAVICDDENTEYSIGHFIWSGFDYIGESTPYDTKNSYFGQLDLAGFPKDSYELFRAAWTDHKKTPMIHVFPYWDFNPGQRIDVTVASNAPEVELFLNGRSLGRKAGYAHAFDEKAKDGEDPKRQEFAQWCIPYEKGVLQAVAYDENGKEIAKEERRSFGDAVRLVWTDPDSYRYGDLRFLEIAALDCDGNIVENANNIVHVKTEGGAELLAVDNGDSADPDQHQADERRLFGGRMLAVVRKLSENESWKITFSSAGMETTVLDFSDVRKEEKDGKEQTEECRVSYARPDSTLQDTIPIRKLEMETGEMRKLTPAVPETEVHVRIFPENADVQEPQWEFVNSAGLPIDAVRLEKKDHDTILLQGQYDGSGYLRCFAKNGRRNVQVLSQLEFTVEGFGEKKQDPMEWILTGLRKKKEGRVDEGLLQGTNFLGKGRGGSKGRIVFENMDFGTEGAEGLEVSVFANTKDAVAFRLYAKKKEEADFHLIKEFSYQEEPEWMCFKSCIYNDFEKLTGVCDIAFETEDAFQFRSFRFLKSV